MKKEGKSYKVIIDSNIWISFLIGRSLGGLHRHIDSKRIKIISCTEQFLELSEVFRRSKMRKYFTNEQVMEFFDLLTESSDCIPIHTKSEVCRDPKDNYLVSLAVDSKAHFLVTGDKDLLDLVKIEDTFVVTYTVFESALN